MNLRRINKTDIEGRGREGSERERRWGGIDGQREQGGNSYDKGSSTTSIRRPWILMKSHCQRGLP